MLFSEVFLVLGQALDLGSCCGRSKKNSNLFNEASTEVKDNHRLEKV